MNYIKKITYADYNYKINKESNKYTVWLNGCRIGKLMPNGDIESFEVDSFGLCIDFINEDAKRRIGNDIEELSNRVSLLAEIYTTLEEICN